MLKQINNVPVGIIKYKRHALFLTSFSRITNKKTMTTTFNTKAAKLPIIALAIIFSLSALLLTSCGGNGNKDNTNPASADTAKTTSNQPGNTPATQGGTAANAVNIPPAQLLTGSWTASIGNETITREFKDGDKYKENKIIRADENGMGAGKVSFECSYRMANDSTVEVYNYYSKEVTEKATFSFEDSNNTLVWVADGKTIKYKRVNAE